MMESDKELLSPSEESSLQCNAKGWIVVFAGFILFAVTLSPSNSYSILFVTLQDDFNATAVETGAIGSLTFTSQLLSSALAFLLERGIGFRPVVILSTISCAGGLALSTLVNRMGYLYLTFGIFYGASTGVCFHGVICILLQHFPQKNTRATATALLGTTIGVLIYSQLLEITLTAFGWHSSMLILASLIILPGLPVSFLVMPLKSFPDSSVGHEEHLTKMMGDTGRGGSRGDGEMEMKVPKEMLDSARNEKGEHLAIDASQPPVKWPVNGKEEELSSSDPSSNTSDYGTFRGISVSEDDIQRGKESKERKLSITSLSWCGDCQIVLSMGRMWIFSIACIMSAMAWCVYFVNIGSFFDSVGLDLDEIAFLLTLMAAMEIAGKLYLATVGECVPVAKIHFLIGQSIIMTSISIILIFAKNYVAMIFLSIVIGFMRALWMTLPYTVSVEVIGAKYADQSVTVTLFCQGIGNLIGNLPADAIYDATGSYHVVFVIVATCTFLAAVLFSILPFLRQQCNHVLPCKYEREHLTVVANKMSVNVSAQTEFNKTAFESSNVTNGCEFKAR